jgi:hypothetical protein
LLTCAIVWEAEGDLHVRNCPITWQGVVRRLHFDAPRQDNIYKPGKCKQSGHRLGRRDRDESIARPGRLLWPACKEVTMGRKILICLFLVMLSTAIAGAQENGPEETTDAKELSGMSIVGNDEAPKALYIVPWKSSDVGVETSLDMMLNEKDIPVDRDVFKRQLDFYEVSTAKPSQPRVAERQD